MPTVNTEQMATAQKLLLFWRKPAVGFSLHSPYVGAGADDSASAGGTVSR